MKVGAWLALAAALVPYAPGAWVAVAAAPPAAASEETCAAAPGMERASSVLVRGKRVVTTGETLAEEVQKEPGHPAAYHFSGAKGSFCPAGEIIQSEQECIAAAQALGIALKDGGAHRVDNDKQQPGCHYNGHVVHWNDDLGYRTSGGWFGYYQGICRGASAPPAPSPECSSWSDFQYVCGDTFTSGHGFTGDHIASRVSDSNGCLSFCKQQGSGCCESRGTWCLHKRHGVERYSYWHSDSRAARCGEAAASPETFSTPSWHWGSGIRGMDKSGGFSWYAHVFDLLQEEEPLDWQMGTAGTWMQPTNIDFDVCACDPDGWPSAIRGDPSYGCCERESKCRWLFSTIEGGPGYWSGSELPTQQMKWRLVITSGCYSTGAQTPLFIYGGKVVKCGDMGTVQVSNRMLLAPDGITFSREGMFGVGFVRTPIGKTSADDERNYWTFVADAENFAGPVAYILPATFKARAKNFEEQSAHLKDFGSPGIGMHNGGGFGFEWNAIHAVKQGDFVKVPRMVVPVSGGKTVLAMNGRGYESSDVYDALEDALSGRKQLNSADILANGAPFDCHPHERSAHFKVTEVKEASLGTLVTEKGADGCTWSMNTKNETGHFPRYFRESDMSPVDESAVPAALRQAGLPLKGTLYGNFGSYDALTAEPAGGCTSSPGPAEPALHCARTSSPSWIAYRWYRFVDQPGLQRLGLSDGEKQFLQARVEELHKTLTGKDRWIKAGAAAGRLGEISGGQLVTPPPNMKYGYVPIALYEGMDKPSGCSGS